MFDLIRPVAKLTICVLSFAILRLPQEIDRA